MDEELRDSLMEWYLRFGEREVLVNIGTIFGENNLLQTAFNSEFITYGPRSTEPMWRITPEGIEALKNG